MLRYEACYGERKQPTNACVNVFVCGWKKSVCVVRKWKERRRGGGEKKNARGQGGNVCVCMRRGGERYERYTRVEKSSGEGVYDVRDACQGACVMRY